MKRILLSGLLAIFSFSLIAQNNNFKPVTKKQNGSMPKAVVSRSINGTNSQKGIHKNYSAPVSFLNPVTPAKRNDVRKIITRNNSPVFIEKAVSAQKSSSPLSPEERFYAFFSDMKLVTRISSPEESLAISGISCDEIGITHVQAVQKYRGVRIYGSESGLHLSASDEIFTGRLYNIDREIHTEPLFSADQVLAAVTRDMKKRTAWKEMSEKEKDISKYESPSFSICILPQDGNTFTLAYEIEIRPNFLERWRYFVDARTGRILSRYNITCSDGPTTAYATDLNGVTRLLDTYLQTGSYSLVDAAEYMYNPATQDGVIMTLNANYTSTTNLDYKYISSATNTWSIPASVSAHFNAGSTYKYFYNTFGRNSLNGQGGNIISLINVTEENGSSMENAFWNGYAVFYGNGGTNFKPLAGALDVTAHELGHGVVSNTANLEYSGQSGAINETYADIFGAMVDRDDWLIGEDITKTGFSPSGALRNMADPHNMGTSIADPYWQPKHVSEMYLGAGDNGGVHLNSGIGNYAYYLYATALASKEKTEKVFYRALTTYLKSTSQFIDLRIAVVQSAKDLYGATSVEASEAAKAFDSVGIHEEEQVNTEQDYSTNPGLAYLLSYDTNTSDPNSLYRSSTSGTEYAALTTTAMKGKVSVTDDGSMAVFVSGTSFIKAINTNPLSPQERNISSYADWDNAAVSKDGNRIAAISKYIDTAIYVFDLVSGTGVKYQLYNPTTSQTNTDAGGVLYADAIEFDITGEYLIYDSYNVLYSTTADPIYYWDIGFINVWDNNLDDYGTGEISKLFGSLPENVSIGNPVFSRNSPYIIAFDYFDTYNNEYAILGTNLQTGDLNVIVYNSMLGYPSYSKEDNKIAYSSLNTSDENVVAVISLNADKISASGSASILVPDAKWPVFYSTGLRELGLKPVSNFTVDLKEGNAPLRVQFLDLSINDPASWSWSFTGGTPSTSTSQNPVVTFNNPGTYNVTLTASNGFGSNTNTKNAYITVNVGTGIKDINTGSIRFYPNPSADVLNISCNSEFVVRILNVQGALVMQYKNQDKVDISHLTKGIYIIEIKTEQETLRRKLIKN